MPARTRRPQQNAWSKHSRKAELWTPRQALATAIVRGLCCPTGVKLARSRHETPARGPRSDVASPSARVLARRANETPLIKTKTPNNATKTSHELILNFILIEDAWAATHPAVTWRLRRLILGHRVAEPWSRPRRTSCPFCPEALGIHCRPKRPRSQRTRLRRAAKLGHRMGHLGRERTPNSQT